MEAGASHSLQEAMRLLLLETRHEDPEHHRGAELFPFLLAWARSRGFEAAWWVAKAQAKVITQGQKYRLDLEPKAFEAILERLRSWKPDVVILLDPPSEDMDKVWRAEAPETRFAVLKGNVSGSSTLFEVAKWIGVSPDSNVPLLSLPLRFERDVFSEDLLSEVWGFHRLAVPFNCSYRRPVSKSRFFGAIFDEIKDAWGCTFCYLPILLGKSRLRRRDIEQDVANVFRQILAYQAHAPRQIGTLHFWLDQSLAGEYVHLLLERLVSAEVRPFRLTVLMRPDQILARKTALQGLLPRLAAKGHRLNVISVGADNLSAQENERFNKGVSPAKVLAANEVAKDLMDRWPTAFYCEDFSCILFTPWTTLEDIRQNILNLDKMRQGLFAGHRGTLLQLWEGTPITKLARHEGAIAERFEGSLAYVRVSCVPPADVREIPWRFLDPKTKKAHEILVRLDPVPDRVVLPADDLYLSEVRALRKTLPPELQNNLSALALRILDAIDALGPKASVKSIFAYVRNNAVVR